MAITNYGETKFEGKTIQLTSEADFTGAVLPAPYVNHHEANEGETYTAEMSAYGVDSLGAAVIVNWRFDMVKGREPELCDLDYSEAFSVDIARG